HTNLFDIVSAHRSFAMAPGPSQSAFRTLEFVWTTSDAKETPEADSRHRDLNHHALQDDRPRAPPPPPDELKVLPPILLRRSQRHKTAHRALPPTPGARVPGLLSGPGRPEARSRAS